MYGKIFETVFTGTLFGSGPTVFAVWAYVIATTKPPGVVELNPKLLAACLGTDVQDVRAAIDVLCATDPDSRNPDEQGRRLVHLEGMQYRVISWQKYRDMRDENHRRDYMRDLMRKKRAGADNTDNEVLTSANKVLTGANKANKLAMLAKAEAEAEAIKTSPPKSPASGGRRGRPIRLSGDLFDKFWQAYPRKASRGQAERAFAAIAPNEQLVALMIEGIERAKTSDQWRRDNGQFIPHPATWLRARGWEDGDPPQVGGMPEWMRKAI